MDRKRVLVVAKTYPELSAKYGETVCTAAVDEDGKPLRLYPIPFRYLAGPQRFSRYQWISVFLRKSQQDTRPESYNVAADSITLESKVPATPDEWGKRADSLFRFPGWQCTSMNSLIEAQERNGQSLAFIKPTFIDAVSLRRRDPQDVETFEQKLELLRGRNAAARKQLDLFEKSTPPLMKRLEFVEGRVCIEWRCSDDDCKGHTMQILDWEICELARKEGLEAAKAKVQTLFNLEHYNSGFILGNFHMFPGSFAIIGLWYPPRSNRLF
jgi:hypothetical protein